jgi:hypothetical protein
MVIVFPEPVVPQTSKSFQKYTLFTQIILSTKISTLMFFLVPGNKSLNFQYFWWVKVIDSLTIPFYLLSNSYIITIMDCYFTILHWTHLSSLNSSLFLNIIDQILLCLLVQSFKKLCFLHLLQNWQFQVHHFHYSIPFTFHDIFFTILINFSFFLPSPIFIINKITSKIINNN